MNKEEFDKMYVGKNIVVHCDTEEKAIEFLMLAEKFGYMWRGKIRYSENNRWDRYRETTRYCLYYGTYGNILSYKGYKIIEYVENLALNIEFYKDTLIKNGLHSCDIYELRTGQSRIDCDNDCHKCWRINYEWLMSEHEKGLTDEQNSFFAQFNLVNNIKLSEASNNINLYHDNDFLTSIAIDVLPISISNLKKGVVYQVSRKESE